MYDFNNEYQDEQYINERERIIRGLCQQYPEFKRKPKGSRRITNYYTYYGIPTPPANRGENYSIYYFNTHFVEPLPHLYYNADDYYDHRKAYIDIRRKQEELRIQYLREEEKKAKQLEEERIKKAKKSGNANYRSANYF